MIHNSLFIIPAYAASPTPNPTSCGTSHENALCKFNQALDPPELTSSVVAEEDPNIIQRLILKINELIAKLGFKPQFPAAFHPRSELQDQSELPPELQPSGPPEEQLPKFLGGDDGIYTNNMPEINQPSDQTDEFEKSFERANYPEGITPITK